MEVSKKDFIFATNSRIMNKKREIEYHVKALSEVFLETRDKVCEGATDLEVELKNEQDEVIKLVATNDNELFQTLLESMLIQPIETANDLLVFCKKDGIRKKIGEIKIL